MPLRDVLCCNLTVQDETEWFLSAGRRDRRLFKTSSSSSALYKSFGATSAHSGGSSSSRGPELTAEIHNIEEVGERTREPELDSSNANLAGDKEDSLLSTFSTQAFLIKNKLSCVDKLGLDLLALQEMSDEELRRAGLSVLDQTRYRCWMHYFHANSETIVTYDLREPAVCTWPSGGWPRKKKQ